jgi:hypothetical protein
MDNTQSSPDVWIERSATLCETDAREAYLALISSQLCWSFPEFVRNVQSQSPTERETGRVAVIEYQSKDKQTVEVFKSSKDLQYYFDDTAAATPRQRLLVLEDLSRNYLEILGSQLRIPPRFFGAHWSDPSTPTFNHRDPFRRYAEDGFVVRYPSTQPVRVDALSEVHGHVFQYNANVNRHLHCYDPEGPIIDQPKSYHTLSFWTSGVRTDDSWDCEYCNNVSISALIVSTSSCTNSRSADR